MKRCILLVTSNLLMMVNPVVAAYTGTTAYTTAERSILPNQGEESFGIAVVNCDLNGDTVPDLVVTHQVAYGDGPWGWKVFDGKTLKSSSMTSSQAFASYTAATGAAYSSSHPMACGDLDGDRFNDVIIADTWGNNGVGYARVFYGPLNGVYSSAPLVITGESATSGFGMDISFLGDVTGDGKGDLAFGSMYSNSRGAVYVVAGGKRYNQSVAISTIMYTRYIGYKDGDNMNRVSPLGDVTGDGKADLMLFALRADSQATGAEDCGAAYLMTNPIKKANITAGPATSNKMVVGYYDGDLLAQAIPGDFNGDGVVDLAFWSIYGDRDPDDVSNESAGMVTLAYGPVSDWKKIEYLYYLGDSWIEGSGNPEIDYDAYYPIDGLSVADFDNDGTSDLLFLSELETVFLMYGGGIPYETTIVSSEAQFYGSGMSDFGSDATNYDVNGDGKVDAVISARRVNSGTGGVYAFFNP